MIAMRLRWPLILVLGIAVVIVALTLFLAEEIPPRSMTRTRMEVTAQRLLMYAQASGRLPKTLEDLPPREGYDNHTTDGWGHPLIYDTKPDGTVTLTSLGKDGTRGGDGENEDWVGVFKVQKADGTWENEVSWGSESWRKGSAPSTRN
jgi:hypothetical protein